MDSSTGLSSSLPAGLDAPVPGGGGAPPLAYRLADIHRRSVLVPGIGWLSLVLGAMGLLWGLMLIGGSYRAIIQQIGLPIVIPPVPPPVEFYKTPPIPRRVSVPEGKALMEGLGQRMSLTPARRQLLENLLVECGDRYAIELGPQPTPEKIAARVREVGALFGEDGQYLIIGAVRIELTDSRISLEATPNRTPRVMLTKTTGEFDPGPRMEFSFEDPAPLPAAEQQSEPAPSPEEVFAARALVLQRVGGLFALSAADGAVAMVVSVILLIAGAATIRRRPIGRSLHLLWASLKIPLTAVSAVIVWVNAADSTSPGTALAPGPLPLPARLMVGGISLHLGVLWIYAIVILIVMQRKSVQGGFEARET